MIQSILSENLAKTSGVASQHIPEYLRFISDRTTSHGHTHHIIPKCVARCYSNLRIYPWNQAILSREDHIIAHRMLLKIFPKKYGLVKAYIMMSGGKYLQELFRRHGFKSPHSHKNSPRRYTWFHDNKRSYLLKPNDIRRETLAKGRVSTVLGKVWVHNTRVERLVYKKEIPGGFVLGRLQTPSTLGFIWVNNGVINKSIPSEEELNFLALGFKRGMLPKLIKKQTKGLIGITNELIQLRVHPEDFTPEKYPGFRRGSMQMYIEQNSGRLYFWINNGEENKQISQGEEIPQGWFRGKMKESKPRKLYPKGKKWYHHPDGRTLQIYPGQVVPEGFILGRNFNPFTATPVS